MGLPDPAQAFGDAQMVRSRCAADPERAFVALRGGELVGLVIASRWGDFGWFGPLAVRPDLWDRGIGRALLEPVDELFARWAVTQAGLFTFAHSVKHVALYHSRGFWPQHLTTVMELAPAPGAAAAPPPSPAFEELLDGCREVAGAILPGLDLSGEIAAAAELELGATVAVEEGGRTVAFAVCHTGAGESGSGACFVKFAGVAPGPGAGERFERLLDSCAALAADRGLGRIVAGVNLACHDAYRRMLARGYRTAFQGVLMQRPNEPGFCRPDAYVLADLR